MVSKGTGMPQEARTVISWALAIGIMAFILLVMAIIFGNLSGNTGFDRETQFYNNESGNLNETGNIIIGFSRLGYVSAVINAVQNATGLGIIPSANYTLDSATGNLTNSTGLGLKYKNIAINFNYTVTYKGSSELDSESIIGNYTESAVNTSQQFPTVGTILGIVVLLAILIGLLVFVITKMTGVTFSGGGSGGTFSGGSKSSQGFERGGMR